MNSITTDTRPIRADTRMFAHSVNAPYEDYKMPDYVELLWIIKTAIIYGRPM